MERHLQFLTANKNFMFSVAKAPGFYTDKHTPQIVDDGAG